MVRKLYLEWGGGQERTAAATEKLAPLWAMRESIWKETDRMAPFGPDYLALTSTLDHINRLAAHFGVPLDPVPRSMVDGAHFTRSR